MRDLLGAGGRRPLRGNLHCHSTGSDGARDPGELVTAYREAGYDFLVITDHFEERFGWPVTDARDLASDGFTAIVGAELSVSDWADPGVFWVGAAGLPAGFTPPAPRDHAEAIRRAADAGAFLWLLHPGLNNLRAGAVARSPVFGVLHAVEIYTHQSAIYRPDTAVAAPFLDTLLDDGHRLLAVAADDAHFRDVPDGFGGWVEVFAAARDEAEIVAALKAGHYYSTQGPAITGLVLDGDELRVSCSPCLSVVVGGPSRLWRRGRWRVAAPDAEPLTEVAFDVGHFRGGPCRLTVVDAAGRRAWSNPLWI